MKLYITVAVHAFLTRVDKHFDRQRIFVSIDGPIKCEVQYLGHNKEEPPSHVYGVMFACVLYLTLLTLTQYIPTYSVPESILHVMVTMYVCALSTL